MDTQLKEALLYQRMDHEAVLCRLCPHYCEIKPGQRGQCQVRENRAGRLYSLVYGQTIVEHVDAIEKKPLFHYYPGSLTYSVATSGCNFHCQFCTNWQVSQMRAEEFAIAGTPASPAAIVERALLAGCRSIAYTYTEPTIFFEYMVEIADAAQQAGLANVLKTNGFFSPEALKMGVKRWTAANVDLKAFCDRTYQHMGGRLAPILETLRLLKQSGVWLEITTVIIPGMNDSPSELNAMAEFIAQELGTETPWHVTRFFPAYGMQKSPPTPINTLLQAKEMGSAVGLQHIYMGNLLGSGLQDTVCGQCHQLLIQRQSSKQLKSWLQNHRCPNCGTVMPGIH